MDQIFIKFDDDDDNDLKKILKKIEKIIEPLNFSEYKYRKRDTYKIKCNWKVYLDNYLEGFHIPRTKEQQSHQIRPEPGLQRPYRAHSQNILLRFFAHKGPYREDPPVHMALGAYISMGDRIGDRVPNNVAVSKETNRSLSPNVGCTA